MNMCWKIRTGRYHLIACISGIVLLYLFGMSSAWSDDGLSVKKDSEKTAYTVGASDKKNNAIETQRDKEKTIYSIGSNKTKKDEEEKDKERSWEMLKNMGIVIDERQDKPFQDKNPHSRTNQNQHPQPVPAQ